MKKALYILIGIISMIVGINGVEAKLYVFDGEYTIDSLKKFNKDNPELSEIFYYYNKILINNSFESYDVTYYSDNNLSKLGYFKGYYNTIYSYKTSDVSCMLNKSENGLCVYECTAKFYPMNNSEAPISISETFDYDFIVAGFNSTNTLLNNSPIYVATNLTGYYRTSYFQSSENIDNIFPFLEVISDSNIYLNFFDNKGSFYCPTKVKMNALIQDIYAVNNPSHGLTSLENKSFRIFSIGNFTSEPLNTDNDLGNECGLILEKSSKSMTLLRQIYKYVKIIIPILIIALGIVDLFKSLVSGKEDDLKKAINKFVKRIILTIVFIVVPILISILIDISGVTNEYSKINDGVKALFCIIE